VAARGAEDSMMVLPIFNAGQAPGFTELGKAKEAA
jgi:hypothetical protein